MGRWILVVSGNKRSVATERSTALALPGEACWGDRHEWRRGVRRQQRRCRVRRRTGGAPLPVISPALSAAADRRQGSRQAAARGRQTPTAACAPPRGVGRQDAGRGEAHAQGRPASEGAATGGDRRRRPAAPPLPPPAASLRRSLWCSTGLSAKQREAALQAGCPVAYRRTCAAAAGGADVPCCRPSPPPLRFLPLPPCLLPRGRPRAWRRRRKRRRQRRRRS